MKNDKNRISAVILNTIAWELGIEQGDCLVSIDHKSIADVFDYSMRMNSSALTVEIEKKNGEMIEFDIEKDEFEDLGIEFERPLMSDGKRCANKCVFCFIDQLPPDMRESLYFKDDDLRLSFLSGNYVTLTNISDSELDRIVSYKISPLNISVHTTDPALRISMMRNKKAGAILDQLRRITQAGIWINCQIVLCPGINDGDELQHTLKDIFELGDKVMSIAIVPVGLTKYRSGDSVAKLEPVGKEDAERILGTVGEWQKIMQENRGERIIYAADEIYIKAEAPFPDADEYEGFPQLENGVGMVPLFMKEMRAGIAKRKKRAARIKSDIKEPVKAGGNILLITGVDARPFLEKYIKALDSLYGRRFSVKAVTNRFFGEQVTVAGLLTGTDIIQDLNRCRASEIYEKAVIPACMLRSGEDVFLDGKSIGDVQKEAGIGILCAEPTGEGLLRCLDDYFHNER
ncbi:MAG: DUF512 domain-containing protein [Saccharofermentanales bacterium]